MRRINDDKSGEKFYYCVKFVEVVLEADHEVCRGKGV